MSIRPLLPIAALPLLFLLAGCFGHGSSGLAPPATDLEYAADAPDAAKDAAAMCASQNLTAVPAGKGDHSGTPVVHFTCK